MLAPRDITDGIMEGQDPYDVMEGIMEGQGFVANAPRDGTEDSMGGQGFVHKRGDSCWGTQDCHRQGTVHPQGLLVLLPEAYPLQPPKPRNDWYPEGLLGTHPCGGPCPQWPKLYRDRYPQGFRILH